MSNNAGEWTRWTDQETTFEHIGERVSVRTVDPDEVLIASGVVVGYSDLLGSGGILQPHPKKGMDFVIRSVRFPQNADRFAEELGNYLFKIL